MLHVKLHHYPSYRLHHLRHQRGRQRVHFWPSSCRVRQVDFDKLLLDSTTNISQNFFDLPKVLRWTQPENLYFRRTRDSEMGVTQCQPQKSMGRKLFEIHLCYILHRRFRSETLFRPHYYTTTPPCTFVRRQIRRLGESSRILSLWTPATLLDR